MRIQPDDIVRYLDALMAERNWYISLHGAMTYTPPLARYNFHLNPFCCYVKTECGCWPECIRRQDKVLARCRGGAFCGACFAGVAEWVYPVMQDGEPVGFVSVSGYCGLNTAAEEAKLHHFAARHRLDGSALARLRAECLSAEIPSRAEVDVWLRPLVLMLEQLIAQRLPPAPGDIRTELLRYVTQNFTRKLTAESVGAHFHYSASTVHHLFKKEFGRSIPAFVTELRMDQAQWLLRNTAYPVGTVAALLGYCDANYFSGVFKHRFGLPPGQFRRSAENGKTAGVPKRNE